MVNREPFPSARLASAIASRNDADRIWPLARFRAAPSYDPPSRWIVRRFVLSSYGSLPVNSRMARGSHAGQRVGKHVFPQNSISLATLATGPTNACFLIRPRINGTLRVWRTQRAQCEAANPTMISEAGGNRNSQHGVDKPPIVPLLPTVFDYRESWVFVLLSESRMRRDPTWQKPSTVDDEALAPRPADTNLHV